MATLTSDQAASTFPVAGAAARGVCQVAVGRYTLAANPSQNDIIQFCKVPAGATVFGGWLQGADIDTGTEAFDLDIGYAANGVESADTDAFGNFGVITGDVSVHLPVAGIFLPFANVIQSAGYVTFSAETTIIGTVNAAANSGGTGNLQVVVFYTVAGDTV